jgi:metal-responsive CopG/Arc/MetJ family transcriptional regulator
MTARQVSVRLTVDLIRDLDRLADEHGVSRNAILEVACYESLERWGDNGHVPRELILRVMRDKKNRTRQGLMRSQQKKTGDVTLD